MATITMAANTTTSASTAASPIDAKPKRQVSHTHIRTSPGNVATVSAAAVSETTVDLETLPEAHKLQLTQTIYGQHSPGQYIRRPLPSASQLNTENDQEQQPQQNHEVCTRTHIEYRMSHIEYNGPRILEKKLC